jgi:hypothetical protein
MLQLIPILTPILGDVIKSVFPNQADQARIESEVKLALINHTGSLEDIRGKIVVAEANSEHWLVSTWRPILMLVIVAIIAMNYLFFPLLAIVTGIPYELTLPTEMWNLLQIGVGGYIVGRSGEKMVNKWNNKQS